MFRLCKTCGKIKLWLRFWVRHWDVQGYPLSERTYFCNECISGVVNRAGRVAADKFRKENE